jgi:hypothetical protein
MDSSPPWENDGTIRLVVIQGLPFTVPDRLLDDGIQLTHHVFHDLSALLSQMRRTPPELMLTCDFPARMARIPSW